jgi:hypothetical protein
MSKPKGKFVRVKKMTRKNSPQASWGQVKGVGSRLPGGNRMWRGC